MVPAGEGYRLRWFTPNVEVDLCGHATLAAAFVVFEELRRGTERVSFETLSGQLTVAREGEALVMDFPAQPASPATSPSVLAQALGAAPAEVLAGADWIAVFENAAQVAALNPDHAGLTTLDRRGVVATAPGDEGDAGLRAALLRTQERRARGPRSPAMCRPRWCPIGRAGSGNKGSPCASFPPAAAGWCARTGARGCRSRAARCSTWTRRSRSATESRPGRPPQPAQSTQRAMVGSMASRLAGIRSPQSVQ